MNVRKYWVTFNDWNYFCWQLIYDFMLVHLTVKFKYDSSKVKIKLILSKPSSRKRINRQLFDK
jgi:hypothetical protein